MKKTVAICTMVLLFVMNVKALEPVRTYAVTPDEFGIEYEVIDIATEDGKTLRGWLYKPRERSAKAVIMSHSGEGNIADLIELASNFVTLGYYVITYDYRGYGESSDFDINPNFYIYAQFENDLNAAINYANRYLSRARTLHLWGVGMGAGLSLAVGANRTEVDGIIADSPYATLDAIQASIASATGKNVLLPLGYNRLAIEPQFALDEKGDHLDGILFIAGDDDNIYTVRDIRRLSRVRRGTSMYTVRGGTHKTNFTVDKHRYFEEIRRFTE